MENKSLVLLQKLIVTKSSTIEYTNNRIIMLNEKLNKYTKNVQRYKTGLKNMKSNDVIDLSKYKKICHFMDSNSKLISVCRLELSKNIKMMDNFNEQINVLKQDYETVKHQEESTGKIIKLEP